MDLEGEADVDLMSTTTMSSSDSYSEDSMSSSDSYSETMSVESNTDTISTRSVSQNAYIEAMTADAEYWSDREEERDFGYGYSDDDESYVRDLQKFEPDDFGVGVARVPLVLLQRIAALLHRPDLYRRGRKSLPRAWMLTLAEMYPGTSLRELRSECLSLLPSWLLQEWLLFEDVLVLQPGGIFARGFGAHKHCKVPPESLSILGATSTCRFREGFASEGMLCNNPPIPLRVLDFLENSEDLLNLALVCKATHQAGHVLLQREFPGGLGPGLLTEDAVVDAIRRRKWTMLENAFGHPCRSSMASTCTMVAGMEAEACAGLGTEAQASADVGLEPKASAGARTEAEACAGLGTEAEACASAGMEPKACAVAEIISASIFERMILTVEMDERGWDMLDWCFLTLLYANKSLAAEPSVPHLPRPSLEWLLRGASVADEWRATLNTRLQDGITMDTAAGRRALAHWAELNITNPDPSNKGPARDTEELLRVLRAAARHGQGVIVHPKCYLHFSY